MMNTPAFEDLQTGDRVHVSPLPWTTGCGDAIVVSKLHTARGVRVWAAMPFGVICTGTSYDLTTPWALVAELLPESYAGPGAHEPAPAVKEACHEYLRTATERPQRFEI